MAKKAGFLLLELLVAFATFTVFISTFSYFVYISLQTKKIALSRLENLNNSIDELEKIKIGINSISAKYFNIKISKQAGNFNFVVIKKEFQSLIKNKQKLVLIGPVK
ncbi:MAG: hypothetical protein ABIF12_00515 [bacterium]